MHSKLNRRQQLAAKILGPMIQELGPDQFAHALLGATYNGDALNNYPRIDHIDDYRLKRWRDGVEYLMALGDWLEGGDPVEPDFPGEEKPAFGKNSVLSDRLHGTRRMHQMKAGDHTVQPIELLESVIFEIVGEPVRINWPEHSKVTKAVTLRSDIVTFIDQLRCEMIKDQELVCVLAFVAMCICDLDVIVSHDDWEWRCHPDWDRVIVRFLSDDDEDDSDEYWSPTSAQFLEWLKAQTGVNFLFTAGTKTDSLHFTLDQKKQLTSMLEMSVERMRNIGYVIDSIYDQFDILLSTVEVRQRVIAGPGKPTLHPRRARTLKALG